MIFLRPEALLAEPQPPLRVELEFQADEGCPSARDFSDRLAARAPVLIVQSEGALRLQVRLSNGPDRARGLLTSGEAGSSDARTVSAPRCEEVADALALVAALLVERTKRERDAALPKEEPPEPAAKPPPIELVPVLPTPPHRSRVLLGAQAIAAKPLTVGPLVGGGLSLFVDSGPSWSLSVSYARNDAFATPTTGRFAWGAAMLGLGPRSFALAPRFGLAVQVASQIAFVDARGSNVDVSTSARRSEVSLGATARLNVTFFERAVVFLQMGAFAPLIKRSFSTKTPDRAVGETSVVFPQLDLGMAFSL